MNEGIERRRGGTSMPAEEINKLRLRKSSWHEQRWAAGLGSLCVDADGQPAIKVIACKNHDVSKGPEEHSVYRLTIERHPHLRRFPAVVEHKGQKYRIFALFDGSEETKIDLTMVADYRAVKVDEEQNYLKNQDKFLSKEARAAIQRADMARRKVDSRP